MNNGTWIYVAAKESYNGSFEDSDPLIFRSNSKYHRKIDQLMFSTSSKDHGFIYLGFYIAFNTVQVISRRVVGRAEETSTYNLSGFCTVNC